MKVFLCAENLEGEFGGIMEDLGSSLTKETFHTNNIGVYYIFKSLMDTTSLMGSSRNRMTISPWKIVCPIWKLVFWLSLGSYAKKLIKLMLTSTLSLGLSLTRRLTSVLSARQ